MKKLVKFLDKKYLNNILRSVYKIIISPALEKYKLSKITSIPKKFHKNFGLKVRYDFFKRAQYYLQTNRINGVYLEFGSHEANTFRMALNTLGLPNKPNHISKFYAFDSFEGMPEPEGVDKQKIWRRGMNRTSEERFLNIIRKDLHRAKAVKGFYNITLPNYKFENNEKFALAYIDCDYYSSTSTCLKFIKNNMQHGCLIAFDDWDCYYSDPMRGQKLAFSEFEKELVKTHKFETLCDIASGGKCFVALEINKIGKNIL
jgi:O-methyltransferase